MKEVNFYLLLELPFNPPEENEDVILAAVNKKRSLWSSMINHPTKKNEARLYLEMIPAIKKVMLSDKAERRKEAVRAKEIKEREVFNSKNKLINIINILNLKGYISIEEIEKIKNYYSSLEENVINSIINKHKIKESDYIKNNRLDSVIYNKIKDNLRIIEKETLYDFLGLSKNASIEELKKSSREIYEALRRITKKDSMVTAKGELQGFCDIVFKNEESKNEYDKKINSDKLKDIEEIIEVCGSKRFIAAEEFNGLINLIKGRSFTEKEAEEYLFDYCIKNRISIIYRESSLRNDIYNKQEKVVKNISKSVDKKEKLQKTEVNLKSKNDVITETLDIPPEVYDVKVKSGYKFIEATYEAPKEAVDIKVWRKEGNSPKAYGDGVILRNVTLKGFRDENLKDNTDYGYLIFVQYRKKGVLLHSDGIRKYGITASKREKQKYNKKEDIRSNPYKKRKLKKQSFFESVINYLQNREW